MRPLEQHVSGGSAERNCVLYLAAVRCVAEALKRGLRKRGRERQGNRRDGPGCPIMVARLDDWLLNVVPRKPKQNITIDPGYREGQESAGFQRNYQLFRERGYRVRLLSARPFAKHMQLERAPRGWNVVISPPHAWLGSLQCQTESEVRPRTFDDSVNPQNLFEELSSG